jgi:hypothetical protein
MNETEPLSELKETTIRAFGGVLAGFSVALSSSAISAVGGLLKEDE